MKRKAQQPFNYMAANLQPWQRPPEPDGGVEADPDTDLDIAQPGRGGAEPMALEDVVSTPRGLGAGPAQAQAQFRPMLTGERPKSEGTTYGFAILFALAMAITPAAFWIGAMRRTGPFQYDGFTFGLLALLGAGMAGLALSLAYSLRQGARLAAEARIARKQAEEMLQPALLAAAGTGSALEAVRLEIDNANAAAERARQTLDLVTKSMAAESALLFDTAAEANKTADAINVGFANEREGLGQLASQLDRQILDVGEAIARQAKMVAEAADLAEAQMREAEATLTARAAELVSAAGQSNDAARIAGEDLSRQAARLETAATSVGEQINGLEQGLAEQRAALVAVSHAMRADQEDFAAQIETQQAQLSRLLKEAHSGVAVLQEVTTKGADTARQLIADVGEHYREITGTAARERENLSTAAQQTMSGLAEAVRRERDALEAGAREAVAAMSQAAEGAQEAAKCHADAARRRVDELGEAAFAAGQKADAIFEARLTEAQSLIAQSANLVEEAGRQASERMGASLEAARRAAGEIEALITQVEQRTARMPADAQERGAQVKAVVDQGVDELLGAARKAAEETQAIDAAFQERVRRNYEMLSEAVRLMGVVSGVAAPSKPLRPSARRAAETETEAEPEAEAAPEAPEPTLSFRSSLPAPPASAPEPEAPKDSDDIGLRPRLKLTPTVTEETAAEPAPPALDAMSEIADIDLGADAAPPEAPASPMVDDGEGWTWKDLLSSIDGEPEGNAGGDRLGERMLEEVQELGIDPVALMPGGRIDQIAAVIHSGDRIGTREVVRRLAPAAVRRLSRRVMADIALRSQTDRFLKRYEDMMAEATKAGAEPTAVAELLATDQGRAFLLMDTAVGGLA
jgi:hypothetical protein